MVKNIENGARIHFTGLTHHFWLYIFHITAPRSCPLYWKATLKILIGKKIRLRILRPRKMNDYVTRRRSFKIFRIASALTMPPFSMKKIIFLRGNLFPRHYSFVLCPLDNFKIHKRWTLTKIYLTQNFHLEVSWESTVIYPTVELTANDTVC